MKKARVPPMCLPRAFVAASMVFGQNRPRLERIQTAVNYEPRNDAPPKIRAGAS